MIEPMNNKILHNKPTFDHAEVNAVTRAVKSGWWACGPEIEGLERDLFAMFGENMHAAAVGSGLGAIRIALLALGIQAGDEVFVPAYTCVAIPNAVLSIGAVPVPADCAEGSFNIDPAAIKPTPKSKAIITVNNFGHPADIAALKATGLPIIEDCAHGYAINPDYTAKPLQSDIAIFSFFATKLIGGGEGGALVSSNAQYTDFAKHWRDYLDDEPNALRLNDKMSEIEAALVRVQLSKMQGGLEKRTVAAKFYHDNLPHTAAKPQNISDHRVWYRYLISLGSPLDPIIQKLENTYGVCARKPVRNWLGGDIQQYPNAAHNFDHTLSLPLYPEITEEELSRVCDAIKECI